MKKFKFILFCLFFLISFYITGSKILNTSLINYLIYNEEQISSIKYNNMLKEISSVVPATTTASTTSMLTGLTPVEHGWLAWNLYFKKEDKIVTMFTNKIKDTDIAVDSVSLARKYFPYKDICELINEEGKYYSKIIAPFNENKYEDIDDMINKIKSSLNVKDKNYIYVYNPEPDTTMHITGTDSKETRDYFELINIVINFLEENKSKNIDLERFNNFVNEFNDVKKKNNLELGVII